MPIEDLLVIWNDVPTRRALLSGGHLPTREGALATFEPVVRNNALYATDLQLIFYDEPVFGPYEGWYRKILAAPRYTDAQADQQHFAALYARIEAERRPLSWWLATHPELAPEPGFPEFYARFYAEIAHGAASASAAAAFAAPARS